MASRSATKAVSFSAITFSQGQKSLYLTALPIEVLATISYVAVRRQDEEEGAVQRILDTKRIDSIAKFVTDGGPLPASVILNWKSERNPLVFKAGRIEFRKTDSVAQVIDGQHRIAGLKSAMASKPLLKKFEIPVVIYSSLNTEECADVFLSINSLQRPVAKSLVTDLYREASSLLVDAATQRARDLADALNEDEDSPYHDLIRFPNDPSSKLGIPLSTVQGNLKPIVETTGLMSQVGLVEFRMQRACLVNFFQVLKDWLGRHWVSRANVFMTAAGFSGAIEFLRLDLIPACNTKKDYTSRMMKSFLHLDREDLIDKGELKGLQGRKSWAYIREQLKARMNVKGNSSKIKY